MTSPSTFSRSKFTERHFIGDLGSLLMRHKLSCGRAEDLEQLGPALDASAALRSDLFTLCTAISHMSDIDLAPEELLHLVARAVAGADTASGEGLEIPSATRAAFLNGYEAWINRKPEKYAFDPEPMQKAGAEDQVPALAEQPPALPEPEVAKAVPVPTVEPIVVPETEPSFPLAPTVTAVPIAAAEPAGALLGVSAGVILGERVRVPYSSRSHARIRRLHAVNAALLCLFLAASASTAIFAYRYEHLEHDYTELATKVDRIVASGQTAPSPTFSRNPLFASSSAAGSSISALDAAPGGLAQSAPTHAASGPAAREAAQASQRSTPVASGTVLLPGSTLKAFAVSTPAPVFPSTNLTGADATVDIQATISIYGMVRNARILRGNAEFGAIAARAMRTWQFRPYLVDGKPVEVIAGFTFHADAK